MLRAGRPMPWTGRLEWGRDDRYSEQDLRCLRPSFRLAAKVGRELGPGALLQRALQRSAGQPGRPGPGDGDCRTAAGFARQYLSVRGGETGQSGRLAATHGAGPGRWQAAGRGWPGRLHSEGSAGRSQPRCRRDPPGAWPHFCGPLTSMNWLPFPALRRTRAPARPVLVSLPVIADH